MEVENPYVRSKTASGGRQYKTFWGKYPRFSEDTNVIAPLSSHSKFPPLQLAIKVE